MGRTGLFSPPTPTVYAPSALWFKIDLRTFGIDHKGFRIKSLGPRALYYSGALDGLASIQGLADSEYGQAIEVDPIARTISFGRDYLGHYPLLYACTKRALYISDDFDELLAALRREGVEPRISEEAVALYCCTGYIPQGMTLFREVVSCEGASVYQWRNGQVSRTSLFQPVEIREDFPIEEVGKALESEVAKNARDHDAVDVWCSGGLDSSIIACLAGRTGVPTDLVTLGYGSSIQERFGDGEQFFVREVSRAYGMPMREIAFTPEVFEDVYRLYVRTHNAPAIDTPVSPKYALAAGSRELVMTGEGGDNFFGGPKNNTMFYARERRPDAPLGWLYAVAHNRWASQLGGVLRRGEELKGYVTDYFQRLFDSYPGDLLRKLFYLNGLYKPASMIYAQSYYPSRIHGIAVRHPMASLAVYRASFTLPDSKKYDYPRNKIVLTDLYADALPITVVRRKKSGTLIPLRFCLDRLPGSAFDLEELAGTGFVQDDLLEQVGKTRGGQMDAVLVYGLVTLNYWLKQKGAHHHDRRVSTETGDHRRPAVEVRV